MKSLAITLLTLFAAACALLAWQHHRTVSLTTQLASAQAAALAADWEASAARADLVRVTVYVDKVRVIHDAITAIQKDIPRYVTPEADRLFPLSVGFVRVHDAASAGVPLLPGTGDPNAARSDVTPSVAASIIAGNYGVCHENAAQLTALQDWVRAHEAPVVAAP